MLFEQVLLFSCHCKNELGKICINIFYDSSESITFAGISIVDKHLTKHDATPLGVNVEAYTSVMH